MGSVIGTYAAYSKNDKLRLESSSGAIFSLLANRVLDRDGVVYGVAMSLDTQYAEYIRVDNQVYLSRLRGSKYLQAKMGRIYQQVKADLESDIVVLFSGTGCQVNGLKGFLGKEYSNLHCVDVICHGVPSPRLWRQYVHYVEEQQNAKLVNVNFRCKDDSWSDFGIKRIDESYKAMYVSKDKDPYMLMFLRDYCLRPSCYECVAKNHKLSDLTMADFWGIDKVVAGMNDGKGVSLVITRTVKGEKLFDSVAGDVISKEVPYEEGVRQNRAEYSSVKRPNKRDYFFNDLNTIHFEELRQKYAIPTSVPLKRRIKKTIKKIILMTPARKFIGGGYKLKRLDYGMLFTFKDK